MNFRLHLSTIKYDRFLGQPFQRPVKRDVEPLRRGIVCVRPIPFGGRRRGDETMTGRTTGHLDFQAITACDTTGRMNNNRMAR